MKRILTIAVTLLLVVALASAGAWTLVGPVEGPPAEAEPLLAVAATFPAPSGAVIAMENSVNAEPLTAVRGWRFDATLDDACNQWREAYRNWIGQTEFGSVSGEVIEGQSCMLEGKKNGRTARLLVAKYGSEQPQATLSITQ